MTTEIPRPLSNLGISKDRITQLSSTQSKKTRNDSIHSLNMELPLIQHAVTTAAHTATHNKFARTSRLYSSTSLSL